MFLEERTPGAKAPSGKKLGRLGKEGENSIVSGVVEGAETRTCRASQAMVMYLDFTVSAMRNHWKVFNKVVV